MTKMLMGKYPPIAILLPSWAFLRARTGRVAFGQYPFLGTILAEAGSDWLDVYAHQRKGHQHG